MPKIEANSLNFHYWISGQGPDVIVLVHGLGGNLAGWHLTIVPELQREYRVLTYDLRGHGRSDAPTLGYTTGDMVQDLCGILDALGIERAVLVGHSWGADIVLHFALLNPTRVSELIVVEGAMLAPMASLYRQREWGGWSYITATIETLLGRPLADENRYDLEFLLRQLIEIPIMYGPAQGRPRDEEVIFRVLDILRPMWEGREAAGNMALASVSEIKQPTLLIYESDSAYFDAYRQLSERLPASSSAMLPTGELKHFSTLEHPELIVNHIRAFLRERRSVLKAPRNHEMKMRPVFSQAPNVSADVSPSNPHATKEKNFVDILQGWAVQRPDSMALTFLEDGEVPNGNLTYRSLDTRAREIASGLRKTLEIGDRVLLLHPPGIEFITAFFGCLYAGVVPVPAYPPRNPRHFARIEAILDDADARCVLTQTDFQRRLDPWLDQRAGDLPVICTDRLIDEDVGQWDTNPGSTPDTLAFLQYTSGSTGAPKGVMVTHGNLLANQRMIQQALNHSEGLVCVSWLPIYHDMGLIGNLMQPLFLGGHCVFMSPAAFLQRPRRWLAAISRFRAQVSGGPNFAFRLCTKIVRGEQKSGLDLSSLDVLFCGSEPIDSSVLTEFAEAFRETGLRSESLHCCYGMAETTLMATCTTPGKKRMVEVVDADGLAVNVATPPCSISTNRRVVVGCGRSVEGQDLVIVDPDGRVLEDGNVGEIWLRGAHVARGYWRKPELSCVTFEARLGEAHTGDQRSFLRTGDLGFVRAGELFVIGRLKDLIIIRGRNHYPHDIELTVQNSHSALRADSGAAVSVDVDGEERLVVIQEIDRHSYGVAEDAVAAIRVVITETHEISPYAVVLVRQNGVAKTSSGKIQRAACARAFLEGRLPVVYEWREQSTIEEEYVEISGRSQEDIEAFLAQKIASSLSIASSDVDLTQPLSALGLDSLRAMTLLDEIQVWLGRKLSPTLFWSYPTISDLAAHLSEIRREGPAIEERQTQ